MTTYICLSGSHKYLPSFKSALHYHLDPTEDKTVQCINDKDSVVLADASAIPTMKILAEKFGIATMVPYNPKPVNLKKEDELIDISYQNNHIKISILLFK